MFVCSFISVVDTTKILLLHQLMTLIIKSHINFHLNQYVNYMWEGEIMITLLNHNCLEIRMLQMKQPKLS